MRSSKSRSRNKSRNQRSLGNVVNRVFDSSGPEGKVRGTPQQIIEKYLALARDAQLSNDRVAEQSFLQHAEHYTRMLGEAQREQAERQAQFGGPQPGQGGSDDRDERSNGHAGNGGSNGNGGGGNANGHYADRRDDRQERPDRRDDRRDDRDRGDRQDRRDDRGDRSDRRDRPRDTQPAENQPAENQPGEPQPAERDLAVDRDSLPDFLRADPLGIPEALSFDDDAAGPVDTPEARTEAPAPDAGAEDDTPRTPRRRSTTPRRPTARKRTSKGEAEAPAADATSDE